MKTIQIGQFVKYAANLRGELDSIGRIRQILPYCVELGHVSGPFVVTMYPWRYNNEIRLLEDDEKTLLMFEL